MANSRTGAENIQYVPGHLRAPENKEVLKKRKKKEIGTHQRDRGAKSKSSQRPNWNDLSNELK